ncbi:MAG: hypothetical protein ACRDH6_02450 [Actinomycetota bacterium]
MIEVTEWAREILAKSQTAAARFSPDTRIRLVRAGDRIEAQLASGPEPTDQSIDLDGMTFYVGEGLEGVVDIMEPHDQIVLRPPGSAPNPRPEH